MEEDVAGFGVGGGDLRGCLLGVIFCGGVLKFERLMIFML